MLNGGNGMYLITGGGTGIGCSLALALAERNKKVLIIGRRESILAATARHSPLIHYCCADVTTVDGRQQILSSLKEIPSLEGLIHNAGIIEPIMPVAEMSAFAWQQILATNLEAPLFLNQMLFSKIQQARVLHIGSGAAHFPVKGWAGYCVSKAALTMLTQCFQLENPKLAFAAVMPGIIDTEMQAIIRKAKFMDVEKVDFFQNLHRSGRLLTPETVAQFLCWLLLTTEREHYVAKEWDIYDRQHHSEWLFPPYQVPSFMD